jgi:hypothetical protein
VPFLRERLRPVPAGDWERVRRLVLDLDDDTFAARERATAELARLGADAEPALRRALRETRSAEVRRRARELLDKREGGDWPAGRLREWRALAALEHIGTAEARRLLQTIARGAPEAWLTQEAQASLERLSRRPAAEP